MDYKLLQLTNNNVGAIDLNGYLPLGNVTGRINCPYRMDGAISVATSGSNVVVIGSTGHYKIDYNASLTVAATGSIIVSLIINGTSVYSVTTTASGAGTFSVGLDYEFKVKDTIPTNVQLQLSGSAATGGVSNTIVEKVY